MHSRKTMTIAVAMLLILFITVLLVTAPLASAQDSYTKDTYAVCGAMPSRVGVGQEVLIWLGITDPLRTATHGWTGITVTVTRPNNTTETLGPFKTDSTGSTGTIYVPSMVGTYYLQTQFPAQWYNFTTGGTAYNIWYKSSSSEKIELVVQEEPVERYPSMPLPAEYWTRPIDAQIREWNVIGGNWLGIGQFADNLAGAVATNNDYAPETAHVLWRRTLVEGGLAGDYLGDHAYHCGDAYEGMFSGTVIINGKVFYNRFNSIGSSRVDQYVVAVDLHTGEELWSRPLITPDGDNMRLSFGQVFYWDSYNVHGVFSYLWTTSGSTWHAFDITDGRWLFSMTDVPSGSTLVGPKGELFRYTVNLQRGWMTLWNSSRVVSNAGSWRPGGNTYDATRGIEWNKTIPTGLPGSVNYYVLDDVMLGYSRTVVGFGVGSLALNNPPYYVWAVSLKPGSEGRLMFNKTYPGPPGNQVVSIGRVSPEDRVFTIWNKEQRAHYGYSLDTGEKLWGPTTPPENQLSIFETWSITYNGKLYTHGTKGVVDCYDIKTGEKLWSYAAADPYTEMLWSDNWIVRVDFIAGGKIYLRHSEHSPVDPKPRGAPFICLDAETGEVVWRVDGLVRGTDWGGRGFIGDSTIVKMDTYSQQIYAIGKGPTQTSAMIRSDVVTLGSSILIQGMVTDISPGTEDYGIRARFPNGVPAVADESMSDWMLYVYKQFPHPEIVGVPVYVHVLDENGNYRNIGETTTDPNGFYSLDWVPDIPGKYSVIVSFAGSKAYYPSYAYTAFHVDEATASTPMPTSEPLTLPPFDMYIVAATVVIVVAIAIATLLIRRKP